MCTAYLNKQTCLVSFPESDTINRVQYTVFYIEASLAVNFHVLPQRKKKRSNWKAWRREKRREWRYETEQVAAEQEQETSRWV